MCSSGPGLEARASTGPRGAGGGAAAAAAAGAPPRPAPPRPPPPRPAPPRPAAGVGVPGALRPALRLRGHHRRHPRVRRLPHGVLHDDGAAVRRIVEQPLIIGAQIGAGIPGAHAGNDGVVSRQDRRGSNPPRQATSRRSRSAAGRAELHRPRPSHNRYSSKDS